ncbi:hypothetical protein ACQPTN_03580 [Bradyrhizobium sp. 13971]
MTLATNAAKPAAAPGTRLLPQFLRNFVRNRETGLVLVGIVVGLLSGVLVAAISGLSQASHALLFDIPLDAHLSATGVISWQRTLADPGSWRPGPGADRAVLRATREGTAAR